MNIFVLSSNLTTNAKYHTDRHVVKMITEQTQLLCSAYYYTDFVPPNAYKLYNGNHPAAKWARASLQNWLWLKQSTLALCDEYEYRYGKTHKTKQMVLDLPVPDLPNKPRTPFAQVMPEQYRTTNAITAYRNFYLAEKSHLFVWTKRNKPPFVKKAQQ